MPITIFFWCFYLIMIDPNTGNGALVRHDFPTELLCNEEAYKIQKAIRAKKPPKCYSKELKGQST